MNAEDHARVKAIFAECIQIAKSERADFVRQRAAGNQAVEDEVLSLLRFHHEQTLLEQDTAFDASEAETLATQSPTSIEIEARSDVEPNLILHQVWKENTHTLRRRLTGISLVLAALIAISMLRLFTNTYAEWGYGFRLLSLVVTLGSAWVLHRRQDLTLRKIRLLEASVMASFGALLITISTRLMLEASAMNDAVDLVTSNHWNHVIWALVILVYGTFMPNSWVRAVTILLPLAFLPYVVTEFAEFLDPHVGYLLEQDQQGLPFPITLVAVGISVFAANLIHDAQLGAIQARYLSQYRVMRLIGSGGMGQVFEAEHRLLKRPCAIKLIRSDLGMGETVLQRFQDEVRASARLTHPNTIEIYDYGLTKDGTFFFAMELLPGKNLSDLVKASGAIPPARVVHLLIQVCGALREAHSAGLIHRDIKPANIFASQRGGIHDFAKLLDFGLVQSIEYGGSKRKKRHVEGTPGYMSPEQILTPESVDQRTDLYALGCVGYFLLTGRPPFEGKDPYEVMQVQLEANPVAMTQYVSAVPKDLESLIMKCIEADREKRFQTAKALQQALKDCGVAGQWTEQDAIAAEANFTAAALSRTV
ncbi:MAG: serine/threonine-protein kinase [Planctomycetota bacterium]